MGKWCNFVFYEAIPAQPCWLFDKFQGFNATLTESVDTPGTRGGDQIKEMDLKLHPELKGPLATLCNDPKTTIVVLSGSRRDILDDVFHQSFLLLRICFWINGFFVECQLGVILWAKLGFLEVFLQSNLRHQIRTFPFKLWVSVGIRSMVIKLCSNCCCLNSFAELWGVWLVAGSRAWNVLTPYKRTLDDNNARAFEFGLGSQSQGTSLTPKNSQVQVGERLVILNYEVSHINFGYVQVSKFTLHFFIFFHLSACIRVLPRQNPSIAFWTSWDFPCVEL